MFNRKKRDEAKTIYYGFDFSTEITTSELLLLGGWSFFGFAIVLLITEEQYDMMTQKGQSYFKSLGWFDSKELAEKYFNKIFESERQNIFGDAISQETIEKYMK